uniref:Uncharacterized protein n=1 Tax=viral metagenome TaxID=1070528 RepID=A0A6C0BI00_9ZZZZ
MSNAEDLRLHKNNVVILLASLQDMVGEYGRVNGNMKNAEEITTQLTKTVTHLGGKIKDYENAISTYEQEFIERRQVLPAQPNLKTLQDYVLVFFFGSYLLVSIFISLYIGRSTRNTPTSIVAFLVMCAVGVMISQVILRFA